MTTLDALPPGRRAVVASVPHGVGIRRRLAGMGLTVGSEVESVISRGRGPIVVAVGQTRLALGRGVARHIGVELVEKPSGCPRCAG
jgi:ferrous iron transport protein A